MINFVETVEIPWQHIVIAHWIFQCILNILLTQSYFNLDVFTLAQYFRKFSLNIEGRRLIAWIAVCVGALSCKEECIFTRWTVLKKKIFVFVKSAIHSIIIKKYFVTKIVKRIRWEKIAFLFYRYHRASVEHAE